MRATVKMIDQLGHACTSATIDGFHFKGQFFPNENLIFCGREFEFTKEWEGVYSTMIDGNYHFFSQDALIIQEKKP